MSRNCHAVRGKVLDKDNRIKWLIGAKIVCCGALLLFLTGILSFSAIGAFISGNTGVWIGGGLVIAVLFVIRHFMRREKDQNDTQ